MVETDQTFVNRRRWKRSNDYVAFTFPGKTQVVFQPIFGTDSLLYIQPARFKFQHTGMFLANPSVTVPIHPVRFNHHFNYRQSLQEFAVTSGFFFPSGFTFEGTAALLSSSRMFSFCPVAGTGSNRESWLHH